MSEFDLLALNRSDRLLSPAARIAAQTEIVDTWAQRQSAEPESRACPVVTITAGMVRASAMCLQCKQLFQGGERVREVDRRLRLRVHPACLPAYRAAETRIPRSPE